jgi:ABC-type multidrug transport system fused ATPase/permease subunit
VGKSTIALSLFRLVEIERGTITVDNINIQTVGLDTIRWQFSIIPQDSLLFAGKLRENIDPTGIFTDAQLHEALERCSLIAKPEAPEHEVKRLEKFKLDSDVSTDGENFSWVLSAFRRRPVNNLLAFPGLGNDS